MVSPKARVLGLSWIVATTLACVANGEEQLLDEGKACIDVEPGDGYRAVVDSGVCLSACDEVIEATCSVTVAKRVVTVTSNITVQRMGEHGCTGCNSPSFACPVPPVEDGPYTLAYGDAVAAVIIPFEAGEGVCTESE